MSLSEDVRRTAPTNPPCTKCGTPMRVTLIEPDGDFEKRMFECHSCKHSEMIRVKYR